MFFFVRSLLLPAVMCLLPFAAYSQGASVSFGGLTQDTTLPVQVSADQLSVSQTDGRAEFSGNVVVTQGAMTLSAGRIAVEYNADRSGIARLFGPRGGIYAHAFARDAARRHPRAKSGQPAFGPQNLSLGRPRSQSTDRGTL